MDLTSRGLRIALVVALGFAGAFGQTLRVATINFWSGLDYQGTFTMGEYESDSTREGRFRILVRELKKNAPDVIALQESNPVHVVASRLAEELNYDYIHQRTNGGIKVGILGLPWNLNEGLVLLARKELRLRQVDVVDLSGTFGLFGNTLSFHFQDQNIALVGAIDLGGTEVTIINTHLSSTVPDEPASRAKLESLLGERGASEEERNRAFRDLNREAMKRTGEVEKLADYVRTRLPNKTLILLGDFNATPDSPEIRLLTGKEQLVDAAADRGVDLATWDAESNANVGYSLKTSTDAGLLEFGGPLGAWYDSVSRRIDYIFLNQVPRRQRVLGVKRILDEPSGGLFASDHYGVMAEIALDKEATRPTPGQGSIPTPDPELEFLPILTYDTDVGFGYGGKAFFLNRLDWSESLDIIIFNSTKGERWYRLVVSVPDFELRQGKRYALAFDLVVDYDKYLKNNFYGIGNHSRSEDREVYTKEPLEVQAVFSRGFSESFVGQVGARFKTVRNFGYETTGLFASTIPQVNHGRSSGLTFFFSFRHDSRNSFINPSHGNVVQLDAEAGRSGLMSDYSLQSVALALQTYRVLFYPKTVLAVRVMGQIVGGANLPVHTYASLGGNKTLRGYPQDRFLDRVSLVSNVEVRFPLAWRFNGLLFADAGTLWNSVGQTSILGRGWKTNLGVGLRFIMETFVVRADLGLSREGTGFYFNFGHVF